MYFTDVYLHINIISVGLLNIINHIIVYIIQNVFLYNESLHMTVNIIMNRIKTT